MAMIRCPKCQHLIYVYVNERIPIRRESEKEEKLRMARVKIRARLSLIEVGVFLLALIIMAIGSFPAWEADLPLFIKIIWLSVLVIIVAIPYFIVEKFLWKENKKMARLE